MDWQERAARGHKWNPRATTSTGDQGAKAILQNFLDQYGLGGLGAWAWTKMLNGESLDQIKLEMRDTPEFKARFPAMEQLAKQGRAISVDQYMAVEDSYRDVMHSYGLPGGFYDSPDDFAKFMIGNVSPSELNDRVKQYSGAVLGDQQTLTEMERLYGTVGHSGNPAGDLLAHYLDPNVAAPLLGEQLQAAQFAGAAAKSGFGQVSKAQAEQFGAQQDISAQEAQQGFGALVHNRELFQALPGQGEQQISTDTQLGAAFGGSATSQEQIEKRRRERLAAAGGGGGFSATRQGSVGLTSTKV